MYKGIKNQKEAQRVIEETLEETKKLMDKFPEIVIYKTIFEKIRLIKNDILIHKIAMTPFEMISSRKYQLGAIVVKNFDMKNNEYAKKLSDIANLPHTYWKLSSA